jgi:hypothetical protein
LIRRSNAINTGQGWLERHLVGIPPSIKPNRTFAATYTGVERASGNSRIVSACFSQFQQSQS